MTNAPVVGNRGLQRPRVGELLLGRGRPGRGLVLASLRVTSRDNVRTSMQWMDTEYAGFTTGKPWMQVNLNHPEINAARAGRLGPCALLQGHPPPARRPRRRGRRLHHALADPSQVYAFLHITRMRLPSSSPISGGLRRP